MDELARFTAKWTSGFHPPERVIRDDLDNLEREMGVLFPMDYRFQILAVGLPSPTAALLTAIADRWWSSLADLSQLYNPAEIKTETIGWRKIGMPNNLVAIGSDSLGNKFCFDQDDLQGIRPAQAPIYYWDHDFQDTDQIAPSFAKWINMYLAKWSDGISAEDF